MEFNAIPLFTINIFKTNIEEWETCKEEILDKVPFDNEKFSVETISYTDYYNCGHEDAESYRKDFYELIEPYLEEFYKTSEYKYETCSEVWCQRYKANDYHEPHTHDSKGYSAVFYANMSPEHKSTMFFAPYLNLLGRGEHRSILVEEGDLVIFPSNLWHMAPPHTSDNERIIFSFNLI